jgi:flavin-dependent dehydrogenase
MSSTRARIGLCATKNVPELFEAFRKRFTVMNVHSVTGTIPIGVRKRTFGDSWMLAGDAAGFPKPTSGGGVYTGIRSARHAVSTALSALENGNTSKKALSQYETLWKNDFGREIELGLNFLKIRRTFTEEDIDAGISAMNNPEILKIITESGDIDRPSALLRKLVMRPEIISLGGRLGIKTLIRLFK